ncbi:hypothetical protein C8A01DRAFT_31109 [Parachaetomium inaequale]|uniref:Uncharacterized protein n=1 Tax=Parachaetomium inaequale TaxID=2588326 RepID=A0AAN6PP42_9PEZI|nr:hypothetical protein C8A01DRAFT_31109 [Parachaetomium inaequale]
MQEPGQQMVTNLALSQGWSFAAVTADAESPESASSGTAQALPQQDGDAVVLEKHQEPDPEVLVPDTVGSEASKTESPAQGSAATDTTAETPSSKDTRTLPSGNETSEDDGGDMIAAIRKSKNKGLRISQPAAQPASSVPPGVPAANTPLDPVENVPQELPSFNDSANNGTKDTSVPWLPGTIGSSFLAQYNYTGNKPQDPKATKKSEAAPKSRKKEADDTAPKHSRKRPTPEIIDLTGAPEEPDNPPARREGKRRKLDENGREKKRHKSQRAESQAYDDARKEQKRPATGRSRQTSQLAQSRNIFQPKPRSQSRYNPQPRTDIPQNQTIIPPPPPAFPRASLDNPQPQPSTYVPLPLRRAQQQQQQNRTLPPPYHEDLLPQPPPQPRETTSALEALGPDRTVIQYVVYRTPRFTPPTSTTTGTGRRSQNGDEDEDEDDGERLLQQLKHSKAIRCSEYLSLPAANSQAAGLQERPRKGVVGKGWGMAASVFSSSTASASASASRAVGGGGVGGGEGEGSNPNLNSESAAAAQGAAPSSGSAAGAGAGSAQSPAVQLYEGKVTYANGEVQYFWVGEETRDLGGPVAGVAPRDMGKAGGFCGVRVDKAGVAIYTRKRFDVWSRVWVGREVRERPRGSGGQRVVFECGGEGGGEDGGEVEGEGGGAKGGVEAEVLVENLDEENKERTGGEEANGVDESGGDGEKGEYNGKGNADNSEIGKLVSNGERNEESNGDGNRDDIGPGTDEGSGREDKNETAADEVTTTSNPRPEPSESQKELPAEEDKEEDDETDDERDTDDADNTRARRSPSVSSTATLAFPPRTSPLDLITITSKLHGTYTTRLQANRAALSTFFDLAKPKNSAMEDNHYYRYELKPEATAQFEEGGYGQQDCATGVLIEWDPPGERPYRWEFLRVQVEVVESELKGPVDIGDMVVEGGEGGDVDGGGLCDEANGEGEERGGNGEVVSGKQAVALPGSVEESEGEVSEEE